MKVFRPLQIGFNSQIVEQNRKFHMVASATLGIDLSTGEALLEMDYIRDAMMSMGDKPLPDPGMPKPEAEFLVSGCYYAPGQKPVTGGEVKVTLGEREKTLDVFGSRQWEMGLPTTPVPFTAMPIDYAHAFGGAGYDQNPDGIGYQDGQLPNIEDPENLITSPSQNPGPAGFSVLDPAWPQRMQFQGTYDENYMRDCFPGYPEDHDWRYFMAAPQDQRQKEYYSGTESYAIYNMHPDKSVIKGTLPGLFIRCFIRHTSENDEPIFAELPLNLDTVWFFPEKELAMLIWRGGADVADDEAEEISHAILGFEDKTQTPRSVEHYEQALDLRITSDDRLLDNLNTEDLIPQNAKCAMELFQEMAFDEDQESQLENNLNAKTESLNQMVDEKLKEVKVQVENGLNNDEIKKLDPDAEGAKEGLKAIDKAKQDLNKAFEIQDDVKPDPETVAFKEKLEAILPGITSGDPKKIELKKFSMKKIDEIMEVVRKFTEKKQAEAIGLAKTEMVKVQDQIKQKLEEVKTATAMNPVEGVPPEENAMLEEQLKKLEELDISLDADTPQQAPLPRINVEEIIGQMSQISPQLMESLQQLQSARDKGIDTEQIKAQEKQARDMIAQMEQQTKELEATLGEAEKGFKQGYVMAAHFMADGLSPHKEELSEVKQRFLERLQKKESVTGMDWACVDLSGQILDGVDLSDCYLEQINLSGASLKGANFSRAIMARANLQGADLSGANFESANVGGVHAHGAKFIGASLKSTKLSRGDFSEADFSRSVIEEVEALEINIDGANFTEAQMPKMKFVELDVKGTRFIRANMSGAVFLNGTMEGADFTEAVMPGCAWADSKIENTCFDKADLGGNCFVATDPDKSGLYKVTFKEACLDKANFQNMSMQGVDMSSAKMENANFGSADLSNANLSDAQAPKAQFRKARLTRANLDNINLMEGSLAKAHLVSASFYGANLYAVDFLRATLGETDFSSCNLDSTLIQDWRPS